MSSLLCLLCAAVQSSRLCPPDLARAQAEAAPGCSGKIHAAAVLSDGRAVSAGDDGPVRVWPPGHSAAAAAAGPLHALEAHKGAVFALSALPGGRLASGGQDKSARGRPLADSPAAKSRTSLRHSPTHPPDQPDPARPPRPLTQVRLWCPGEAGSLAPAALEPAHAGVVRALAALSADALASGSDDRTVRVWRVDLPPDTTDTPTAPLSSQSKNPTGRASNSTPYPPRVREKMSAGTSADGAAPTRSAATGQRFSRPRASLGASSPPAAARAPSGSGRGGRGRPSRCSQARFPPPLLLR